VSARVTPFDLTSQLVVVPGEMWGPRGERRGVNLIVDTGAAMTTIKPHVLDELGYSPRMGEYIARVGSVVGTEHTYTLCVDRFGALGFGFRRFLVNAAELSTHSDIQGLIGIDFLRQFDCTFQFSTGAIVLDPIAGRT